MTVKLDLITPAMDVHAHGCADVARTMKQGRSRTAHAEAAHVDTFEGKDFDAVVLALDTDLAEMFGEEPYQENATAWSYANCQILPCARKLEPKGWVVPQDRPATEAATVEAIAYPCRGKWSVCGGANPRLTKANWNLCSDCTARRAQMKV